MKEYSDVLKFVAMRRSGHHAIIEWIAEHSGYNVWHSNDVVTLPGNIGEPVALNKHEDGLFEAYYFNIEDFDPLYEKKNGIVNPTSQDIGRTIFIYRSPLNLFASRIKHYRMFQAQYGDLDKFVNATAYHCFNAQMMWIEKQKDVLVISYDRWVEDEKYRQNIGLELNLSGEFWKKHMKVSEHGKGSSFTLMDNTKIQKKDERFTYLTDEEKKSILSKIVSTEYVECIIGGNGEFNKR